MHEIGIFNPMEVEDADGDGRRFCMANSWRTYDIYFIPVLNLITEKQVLILIFVQRRSGCTVHGKQHAAGDQVTATLPL